MPSSSAASYDLNDDSLLIRIKDEEEKDWSLFLNPKYHPEDKWRNKVVKKSEDQGKTSIIYQSGMNEINFTNKVRKLNYPDGY
jgi:hypothetical protein